MTSAIRVIFLAILFASSVAYAEFGESIKAANEGDIEEMHNVGYAYVTGREAEKNYPEAMRWFTRAAYLGQHNSMYSLAIMYRFGQGVSINLPQAYAWYSLAADFIPKGLDEWFIPRSKIAMYERRPRELAAEMTPEQLELAQSIKAALKKEIQANSKSH